MRLFFLIFALFVTQVGWSVEVYTISNGRTGDQITYTYVVRSDAHTTLSGQITEQFSGEHLTAQAVRQAVFAHALRFQLALDAVDRLSTYSNQVLDVPDSAAGGRVGIGLIQRTTDSATLTIPFDVRDSASKVIYGPSAMTVNNVGEATWAWIRDQAFRTARRIEAAMTTKQALDAAVGEAVTVQ